MREFSISSRLSTPTVRSSTAGNSSTANVADLAALSTQVDDTRLKSFQEIEDAFNSINSVYDDLTAVRLDSPLHRKEMKDLKKKHRLLDDDLKLDLDDPSLSSKVATMKTRASVLSKDPVMTRILRETTLADQYLAAADELYGINQTLGLMARKDFMERYSSREERDLTAGFDLNINAYLPMDVDAAIAAEMERSLQLEPYLDTRLDETGKLIVVEKGVKARDPNTGKLIEKEADDATKNRILDDVISKLSNTSAAFRNNWGAYVGSNDPNNRIDGEEGKLRIYEEYKQRYLDPKITDHAVRNAPSSRSRNSTKHSPELDAVAEMFPEYEIPDSWAAFAPGILAAGDAALNEAGDQITFTIDEDGQQITLPMKLKPIVDEGVRATNSGSVVLPTGESVPTYRDDQGRDVFESGGDKVFIDPADGLVKTITDSTQVDVVEDVLEELRSGQVSVGQDSSGIAVVTGLGAQEEVDLGIDIEDPFGFEDDLTNEEGSSQRLLNEAIMRRVPEGMDPEAFSQSIRERLGIDENAGINDVSPEELDAVVEAELGGGGPDLFGASVAEDYIDEWVPEGVDRDEFSRRVKARMGYDPDQAFPDVSTDKLKTAILEELDNEQNEPSAPVGDAPVGERVEVEDVLSRVAPQEFIDSLSKHESQLDPNALLGFPSPAAYEWAAFRAAESTINEVIKFTAKGSPYAEYSKKYKKERNHGDPTKRSTPIGIFQMVGTMINDLATEMEGKGLLSKEDNFDVETQVKMFKYLYDKEAKGKSKEAQAKWFKAKWEGFKLYMSDQEVMDMVDKFIEFSKDENAE